MGGSSENFWGCSSSRSPRFLASEFCPLDNLGRRLQQVVLGGEEVAGLGEACVGSAAVEALVEQRYAR